MRSCHRRRMRFERCVHRADGLIRLSLCFRVDADSLKVAVRLYAYKRVLITSAKLDKLLVPSFRRWEARS